MGEVEAGSWQTAQC